VSEGAVRPVRVRHVYQAAPAQVFDAWITPSIARQWLFVGPASKIVGIELDARIGGEFSILERGADGDIDHFGEYQEVDRPNRLAFTLEVPWHFPGVTQVSIRVTAIPGGTELILLQTGVAPEITEPSWRTMLSKLEDILKGIG
jgi:uncharacterized protein YndB with AHSA1/START domain